MEDEAHVRVQLRNFLLSNYLFGDRDRVPDDDASLMQLGLIDSTGVLELIEFLEEEFGIVVLEVETVPENLDSIDALSGFVIRKASMGSPKSTTGASLSHDATATGVSVADARHDSV